MATERETLEAEEVEALVAKWGEGEREASVRMIRGQKRSMRQLRFDAARRQGDDPQEGLISHNIARGCLDDGYS